MLIAIRHGSTPLNSEGAGEKSRGWLPVGLSHQGVNEMMDTADSLRGLEDVRKAIEAIPETELAMFAKGSCNGVMLTKHIADLVIRALKPAQGKEG